MKNRKLLYFLLPAVAVIWGVIIYRVISFLSHDAREQIISEKSSKNRNSSAISDTFSLLLKYPDPFGLTSVGGQGTQLKTNKQSPLWPSVTFYGAISTGNGQARFASVRINGNEAIMKRGDTFGGIKLLAVKGSGIRVSYKGMVRDITNLNNEKP